MIYKLTFKGSIPKMSYDSTLGKGFSDSKYGYQIMEINCQGEKELSECVDKIINGTDLKLIGVDWDEQTIV